MNKEKIIFFSILICVIGLSIWFGMFEIGKLEERNYECKNLCENKSMEYYDYGSNKIGKVVCECLDNGIENKFMLKNK